MNESKDGIKIKVQESKVQEMRSSAGNKQNYRKTKLKQAILKDKQGNIKVNIEFTQIGIQISHQDEVTQTLMYVCY